MTTTTAKGGLIALQRIADPVRGVLGVAECGKHVPFAVRRLFYMNGMPENCERGGHAHRQQQQFLICLHGVLEVEAIDRDGTRRYLLTDSYQGLHAAPMTWLRLWTRSPDTICLVLASDVYDEADYVRDWDRFEELLNGGANV